MKYLRHAIIAFNLIELMGLIGIGNDPMAGASVAVAEVLKEG